MKHLVADARRIKTESHHRVSKLVERICHIGKIEREISCLFEKMEDMCHVEEFLEHDIEFSEHIIRENPTYFREEEHPDQGGEHH